MSPSEARAGQINLKNNSSENLFKNQSRSPKSNSTPSAFGKPKRSLPDGSQKNEGKLFGGLNKIEPKSNLANAGRN